MGNEKDTSIIISVIVPVYNIEKYLEKCIKSIISQSYKNIEVILIDDGSTDGSSQICDVYKMIDDRIRVIHKKNEGPGKARRLGVDIAKGEYIVFVDGDDWIELDRIKNLVERGIKTNVDMVYLAGMWKDYDDRTVLCEEHIECEICEGEDIINTIFPMFIDTTKAFCVNMHWAMWMWAIKRELLQKVYPKVYDDITMGEDQACVWMSILMANKVSFIKETGYHYVQRTNSIMNSVKKLEVSHIISWYQCIKEALEQYKVDIKIREVFIHSVVMLLMQANYELLLKDKTYLYPYRKVKEGSNIVLYGAGKLGINLKNELDNTDCYDVVAWVDKNKAGQKLYGCNIETVESICNKEYDYVVVAVMDSSVTEKISKALIDMGVSEEKIALIDRSVLIESELPDELKYV